MSSHIIGQVVISWGFFSSYYLNHFVHFDPCINLLIAYNTLLWSLFFHYIPMGIVFMTHGHRLLSQSMREETHFLRNKHENNQT